MPLTGLTLGVFHLRNPHRPTAGVGQFLCFGQITLTPPQGLFPLFALGDIHSGPDKFYEVARLVQDRMPGSMEVLDGSIGKNNAIVRVIVCFLDYGFFKEFLNALLVLDMISAKPKFNGRRILIRLDAEYSKYLR